MGKARGGLEAMYVLAAGFMFVAAVVVVIVMLIDSRSRPAMTDEAYRPGTVEGFQPRLADAERLRPGLVQVFTGRYELILHAYNWEFVPAEVRIPRGSEVTIRAWSKQDFHGVAITGTDIVLTLEGNREATAEHFFDTPGEYLLVCSEFCGAGHIAMQGKIIVE